MKLQVPVTQTVHCMPQDVIIDSIQKGVTVTMTQKAYFDIGCHEYGQHVQLTAAETNFMKVKATGNLRNCYMKQPKINVNTFAKILNCQSSLAVSCTYVCQ